MSERKLQNSEVVNQELWQKASKVSSGINKLIWAHTCFYIVNHINDVLSDYDVYLNNYGKFSVKIDEGSEFNIIQPCPWLIYQLYDAKSKINKGSICDEDTTIRAKAYEKFENFFKYMIHYCDVNLTA